MTTPLDAGPDPDPSGERRGLESYPEFLAYPVDPNVHETAVMPRIRAGTAPVYQTPYSPSPASPPADGGARPPAAGEPVYPESYIKDKPPAEPAPIPDPWAPQSPPP